MAKGEKVVARNKNDPDYELPDGHTVRVGIERYEAPEVLFNPKLHDLNIDDIHKMVQTSLNKVNTINRKVLSDNIILSGGNMMLSGLELRLKVKLIKLGTEAKIKSLAERQYAASRRFHPYSFVTYQNLWISREKYTDSGAGIINTKHYD
ncbi:Actin, aortic smooth muscle [Podila verticillata]|nr:Actin, aortic smooth muscle [Podila verticillata]